VVFLESPRRMQNLLQVIHDELGSRFVVIAKEMTKLHEEVIRGPVEDLIEGFTSDVKGEYTVVVAPDDFKA